MTAGVPVVGARAVGTMDLIEDKLTGLLVEPGAGRAAGQAAAELLTHPQRARTIAEAASEFVSKRHDRAAMARATEEVYRDLMPSA
jgi:glycosyltransferase involved in cell wall biosynthesis